MNVLGVSEGFHDAGVCLLRNDRIYEYYIMCQVGRQI